MDEIGDEFNDESGNDETEEELPELTNESDEPNELDDDIPETFSEPDEFDDDIPEIFNEPDEFDDIIPDVFSEPDEFDDSLDDIIPNKKDGERADEDQDSGDVGNIIESEIIGPSSNTSVLIGETVAKKEEVEILNQEEIEIVPEDYEHDEIQTIENASNTSREIPLEKEEKPKLTDPEEFEYLWEIRDKLDREGKLPEEIDEVMHEAEEVYQKFKNAEKIYEEQQQEKLKLVDHEDE